jgi:N-acetylgalactosamine kinase
MFRTAREWLAILNENGPALREHLREVYGAGEAMWDSRRRHIQRAVEVFARWFGRDRPVLIARSPGRVNLMGRHVDHRGGYVNMITIHREIVAVASPRDDSVVRLVNVDDHFEAEEFDVSDELPHIYNCDNWHDYLSSERVKDFHSTSMGKWSNYVRAGIYRLCHDTRKEPFVGMDAAIAGDVPIGAGLSSSSALLVATSLAAIAINGLRIQPAKFVDLCGEGEWFVGTRGGAADHAAVALAVKGKVTPISFLPFHMDQPLDFPAGYRLIVCDSRMQAKKTQGARDTFNHRVACYEIGVALFRKFFPRQCEKVEYLRDLTPEKLGVSLGDFYRMIARLPETVDRTFLRQLLQDRSEWLEKVFETHRQPMDYPLRAVLLFGIAECRRSEIFGPLLAAEDVEAVGQLMRISHEGDRVVSFDAEGTARLPDAHHDDVRFEELARLAESEDPEAQAQAQLERQAGGYACSCWEIDQMVDIAQQLEGVVGAQLSGAGMGGCMMVLAREDAVDKIREALVEGYYGPRKLEPEVEVCQPVAGARVLTVEAGDGSGPSE